MIVAVTGGSGYVGRPTVRSLRELGATAVSVSRRAAPGDPRQAAVDVMDRSTWPGLQRHGNPDRLVHLAWGLLGDYENPAHYLELLPAHLEFVKWCVDSGIRDITVAGTCFEYGNVEGELLEESETVPSTAYGFAKDSLRRSLHA